VASADRDLKECRPPRGLKSHCLCFQVVRGSENSEWNSSTWVAQVPPTKPAPNRISLGAVCLLHKMAPQVGLEPTTLRLTAGQCASCSLILKAFLAVQGRHNRCTWGVWLDKLLDNLSTSPRGLETERGWRICIGTNAAHRPEGRLQYPHLPVALGSPSEIPLPLLV
jgi:hypothetical protein